MATLEQLEQALRAADAAGNTEDARRLAQAYKAQRDAEQGSQAPAAKPPITDLPPVQAVAPDGWEYGMGRDAAFGLRSILQGGGSLLGALGGDALGALETKITGRPVASFRDNAGRCRRGADRYRTDAWRRCSPQCRACGGTHADFSCTGAYGSTWSCRARWRIPHCSASAAGDQHDRQFWCGRAGPREWRRSCWPAGGRTCRRHWPGGSHAGRRCSSSRCRAWPVR